jgi:antitoxin VapB
MIHLSQETEGLALKLAEAQHVPADVAILRALQREALMSGVSLGPDIHRRMTSEEMLAFSSAIARLPLQDPRSPDEIMADLNA